MTPLLQVIVTCYNKWDLSLVVSRHALFAEHFNAQTFVVLLESEDTTAPQELLQKLFVMCFVLCLQTIPFCQMKRSLSSTHMNMTMMTLEASLGQAAQHALSLNVVSLGQRSQVTSVQW